MGNVTIKTKWIESLDECYFEYHVQVNGKTVAISHNKKEAKDLQYKYRRELKQERDADGLSTDY